MATVLQSTDYMNAAIAETGAVGPIREVGARTSLGFRVVTG